MVLDNEGNKVECEILYTFHDKESNIDYIIYNDGELDENGKKVVYASRYEFKDNDYILKDIENDSEWDLIDDYLASKRN
jgi:uncharacterized protein YrzB (UPF0473 family)